MHQLVRGIACTIAFCFLPAAYGQTAAAPPAAAPSYGSPITLDQARTDMEAAEAEARKNNGNVAIAIVDSGAHLVMLHKIDDTQHASIDIAHGKATSAVNLRRPTKSLEDAVAAGGAGLRLLAVRGIYPLEGGIPIVLGGKIVGGIGVSGVTSSQDAQVARVGMDALK